MPAVPLLPRFHSSTQGAIACDLALLVNTSSWSDVVAFTEQSLPEAAEDVSLSRDRHYTTQHFTTRSTYTLSLEIAGPQKSFDSKASQRTSTGVPSSLRPVCDILLPVSVHRSAWALLGTVLHCLQLAFRNTIIREDLDLQRPVNTAVPDTNFLVVDIQGAVL